MALIAWSDELSVSVAEIDAQHKVLLGYINKLHDAMTSHQSKDVVNDIIAGLAEYTISHFGVEEAHFAEFKYSGADEHKKEHDKFVKKVTSFQVGYGAGHYKLSMEILIFLTDWLVTHIKGTDKLYTPCFHEHGLK